jgi:hypothetical protein
MKIFIAILKLIIFTLFFIILWIPKQANNIIKLVIVTLSILNKTITFLLNEIDGELKKTKLWQSP